MPIYTVTKGSHFSFPRLFKISVGPEEILWKVQFHENCNYVHKTLLGGVHNDQFDWNKLCGVFFSMFNTRKHAAMIGWRYNIKEDCIELSPYYHISGSRDMFAPLLKVKRNEAFEVKLKINYENKRYSWFLSNTNEIAGHEMNFDHEGKLCGFINFYFGGNKPAPQDVSALIEVKVKK